MKVRFVIHHLVAIVLLVSLSDVGALRGAQGRRRETSLRQNRRREEKNSDAAMQAAMLEMDDPEYMAAQAASENAAKGKSKRKKSSSDELMEPEYDSEESEMSGPDERQNDSGELPESKGSPKNSGTAKGGPTMVQEDAPTFDEADIYTAPDPSPAPEESPGAEMEAQDPGSEQGSTSGGHAPGTPSESDIGVPDLEIATSTMTRQIPVFSIEYTLSEDASSPAGPDGILTTEDLPNYNELLATTDMHIDSYFAALFSESPASYTESSITLHVTADPLVIDLHVGASFSVPGQIPTMTFMFDKIRSAFEYPAVDSYYEELSRMAHSNPFRHTTSVTLVNHAPNSVEGGSSGNNVSQSTVQSDKKDITLPLLAGLGCLVLMLAAFVWIRKSRSRKEAFDDDSAMLLDEDDASSQADVLRAGKTLAGSVYSSQIDVSGTGKTSSGSVYYTQPFGPDDDTLKYLESIREKYQEDDDDSGPSKSRTELEEVSLESDSDEESNSALDSDASTVQAGGGTLVTEASSLDQGSASSIYGTEDLSHSHQIPIETVLSEEFLEEDAPIKVSKDEVEIHEAANLTNNTETSQAEPSPSFLGLDKTSEERTSEGLPTSEPQTSPQGTEGQNSTQMEVASVAVAENETSESIEAENITAQSDVEVEMVKSESERKTDTSELETETVTSEFEKETTTSESEESSTTSGNFNYLDLNSSFDEDLRSLC